MNQVIIQLDHERRLVVYAEGGCSWERHCGSMGWTLALPEEASPSDVRDLAIAMGWAQNALINLLLPDEEDAADASDEFLAQPPGVCPHEFHDYGTETTDHGRRPLVYCQLCGQREE